MGKVKTWKALTPEQQSAKMQTVFTLVTTCPGLTVADIAKATGLFGGAVRDILRSMNLIDLNKRLARSVTCNVGSQSDASHESLYPLGPYRIAHVDTTTLGIRVVKHKPQVITAGCIVDGLTGYVVADYLTDDVGLDRLIVNASHAGHTWQVYLFDNRADNVPAMRAVERMRKTALNIVAGSLLNNVRVERVHHFLRRSLMCYPAGDYAGDRLLRRRIADVCEDWNNRSPESPNGAQTRTKDHRSRTRLQRIGRDWSLEELRALAKVRRMDVVGHTSWPGGDQEPIGVVFKGHRPSQRDQYIQRFADLNDDGFYWAVNT